MRRLLRAVLVALFSFTMLIPAPAALPAAAFDAQAASYTGSWSGQTRQNKYMTFRVNRANQVVRMDFGYRIPACGVRGETELRSLSARIRSTERFTVRKQVGDTEFIVRGHMLSRRRAEGTLRMNYSRYDFILGSCESSAFTRWNARR